MKKTEHDLDLDAFDELEKSSDSLKQKINQYHSQDENPQTESQKNDQSNDEDGSSNILADVPSYQLKTILIGLVGLLLFFVLLSLFLFSDEDEAVEPQHEELAIPDKTVIQANNTPSIARDKNERVVKTFRLDSIDEIDNSSLSANKHEVSNHSNPTTKIEELNENKAVKNRAPKTEKPIQKTPLPVNEIPSPLIDNINPTTVIGLNKRQTIQIIGRNFSKNMLLHLSWQKGNVKRNKSYSLKTNADQLVLKDSRHIELKINTGKEKSLWTVKIQQGKQFSSAMNFEVVPPFSHKQEKPVVSNKMSLPRKSVQDGNQYVLSAPSEHYAAQIMSASKKQKLNKIVANHKDIYPLYVVKSQRQGKDWYSLVYGDFSNKQAAKNSLKQLPSSLSKHKIWIRSYQSLQQQLNATTTDQKKQKNQAKESVDAPQSTKKAPAVVSSSENPLDEQKILSINPSRWTLQLLSSRSIKNINEFAQKHQIQYGALIYQQTDRLNQTNYILIYGVYASQAHARNAIKSLPQGLQTVNPWVRSYMDIQQIVRNRPKAKSN